VEELRIHEEVDPEQVSLLVKEIRSTRKVVDPIWVAEGSGVILNGHHRFAALRVLGAKRVPAWVFDYSDPTIQLDRWKSGPTLAKAEVLHRAEEGTPFPSKTTRHRVRFPLPRRVTALAALLEKDGGASALPPSRLRRSQPADRRLSREGARSSD
jgi:hypothetical protein